MAFPQLYTISAYSLLSSTIRIEKYVQTAKKMGYTTIGIADINVLHGVVEFFEACKRENIKAIIGLTLEYVPEKSDQTEKVILYAKDLLGYQQLMKLSSIKMTEESGFTLAKVKKYLSHLFAILPPEENEILTAFERDESTAENNVKQLKALFDENSLFVSSSLSKNEKNSVELFDFYQKQKLELIAVQEVRYLNREDGFALEVMEHINTGQQMQIKERIQESIEGPLYLRDSKDICLELQAVVSEQTLKNTEYIAENCIVEIPLHQTLLPHYSVPQKQTAGEFLEQLCFQELPKRVADYSELYVQRLKKELAIIHSMGFDDYFLIVWDVMAFAHQQKIVTGAGRGSAAGSLVSYVLSITDVDPIKYDLLFERFLNPERHSMPDIDLDIPDNKREEVLQYVRAKYGQTHMAQISTFGTMAAKMVLRDVARVFGLSQSEASRWATAVPNALKMTLKTALGESKKLQELATSTEINQLLFDTALRLEGLQRHVSTHAAGVVISDKNLVDLVPLQSGSNDIYLTQFTMNDVEKIGLLKMDFLGLRNLSIIDNTLKGIKRVLNEEIKLNDIPFDDEATLALFRKGETAGIFQFESTGIRNVLRKLGPTSIEDIAAVNALYRPGPMQNIDLFIERKKGKVRIDYLDSCLEPILKNTHGIIVYQEQIIQIASSFAGFSLGQADILRRAVSKKKKSVLDEERKHFIAGALQQGHEASIAAEIYDYIERFANYGFNRSHAFAYSFIGFQMAYLKVHYPGAFYTAILNSVRHNTKKIKEYIGEVRKNAIEILPPSINASDYGFFFRKDNKIIIGFSSLKGIRRDFIQNIIDERKENGQYQSFDQFLIRIDRKWLKNENIYPLIMIGAFDELESNRRQLADRLDSEIQNIIYSSGSMSLLEDTLKLKKVTIPDFSLEEKLEQEEYYLGLYLSGHPTEEFKKIRMTKQLVDIADITEKQEVHLLVYVKDVRTIRTKKGEQMAFVEGDDITGSLSLTIFPGIFRQLRQSIEKNEVYYVEGKIERSTYNQELQLLVNKLEKADIVETNITEMTCFLKITKEKETNTLLQKIREILTKHKGRSPVILFMEKENRKMVLGEEYWITVDQEIQQELSALLGSENVVFK